MTNSTHRAWVDMRNRVKRQRGCYKGVDIHAPWLWSYFEFLDDMGERPKGMVLDRIDGTKGYHPDNCRWTTYEIQNRNRKPGRNNRSGVSGVRAYRKGWMARLGQRYLGCFDTFEAAVEARRAAEIEYWGETSMLKYAK